MPSQMTVTWMRVIIRVLGVAGGLVGLLLIAEVLLMFFMSMYTKDGSHTNILFWLTEAFGLFIGGYLLFMCWSLCLRFSSHAIKRLATVLAVVACGISAEIVTSHVFSEYLAASPPELEALVIAGLIAAAVVFRLGAIKLMIFLTQPPDEAGRAVALAEHDSPGMERL